MLGLSLLMNITFANCKPYFSYSDSEIAHITDFETQFTITKESLKKWDDKIEELIELNNMGSFDAMRAHTYLYVAQEEAAALSEYANGSLKGSLDPLCEALLGLFFTKYSRPQVYQSDIYSAKLRNLVLPRLKERIIKEDRSKKMFVLREDLKKNPETNYDVGRFTARWIPWVVTDPEVCWPPQPPSSDQDWNEQISEIKNLKKDLTAEQRDKILFWASQKEKGSGDWVVILNDYMFQHQVSLEKMLFVRSQFMKGYYDATIVYFGSKYYYSMIRPKVRDPSITYEVELPNHPSYPAGHSTIASMAETLLSYYFPENREEWRELAEEAGLSRIWAGIHYPIDIQAGNFSGKCVAEAVINSCK